MKQLQQAIEIVNKRYQQGLNDDDQVRNMIEIAKRTKGYYFHPSFDTYQIVTDEEKMKLLSEKYGYWSEEVKAFNSILRQKSSDAHYYKVNEVGRNTAIRN